ncbi:hypothetical protein S7711_10055 [Stachybotrys chartarum IBT 7711]|uniref:FAD-binding domain-containing protein n=1 Tax=Stachybotrys chartarum (strain CBS 109288 / IBT 7711) TaxID=1280523 RepID=A0A084AEY4_STACB|nr:hypothetical protein S7711_10055 [Stachybotrys chartarum IBT 7711]
MFHPSSIASSSSQAFFHSPKLSLVHGPDESQRFQGHHRRRRPIGLTAAHALTRAGIDFIVLERRDNVVVDAGSNFVLNPEGLRAIAQLNLLDKLEKVTSAYPRVLSRHDLTQVLFESLPTEAKAKIFTKKKVSNVESTADGMTVSCKDGTSYTGSLVIAADGAHSIVRQSMRMLALESGSSDVNEERPFLATYRALWIRFSTTACPSLAPGAASETHRPGASTQLFVGQHTGVIDLYERLENPTTERVWYTQEDQDACIKKWGFLPLTEGSGFTLGDAYEKRTQSGLVSLEEGVVEHWSWGRVVLVGDAAHKFTPSTGAGCNHGICDVVALANALNKGIDACASSPDPHAAPTEAQIGTALKAYRNRRYAAVVDGCAASGRATALSTWATGVHRFIDRWVLWAFVQKAMINYGRVRKAYADTTVFDYIEAEERFSGKARWTTALPTKAMKA